MPPSSTTLLEPRKSPVQARSTASVDAILQATVQVLLSAGKERLTTTKVAARAGVSVGTLYQYFPNKSALLQAALTRHLDEITDAVERVCLELQNRTAEEMAEGLITAFLGAKMRDPVTSVAIYSVSTDVDGATIARQMGARCNKAIVEMLSTASHPLTKDPRLIAEMLQSSMAGLSRRLLESDSRERDFEALRLEMIFFARAYLGACSA